MFEKADVAWGFTKAPPSKSFEELTLAEIETAAADCVQQEIKKKTVVPGLKQECSDL